MLCINCGVPQWSIGLHGPLLFTIYINDIVKITDTLQMILFADDTNLFLSGPNLDDICIQLNIELKKLSRWFKLYKLSLHKDKFYYFRSKLRHLRIIPNVKIDENKINTVDSNKFLGIIINSWLGCLDWSHMSLVNR